MGPSSCHSAISPPLTQAPPCRGTSRLWLGGTESIQDSSLRHFLEAKSELGALFAQYFIFCQQKVLGEVAFVCVPLGVGSVPCGDPGRFREEARFPGQSAPQPAAGFWTPPTLRKIFTFLHCRKKSNIAVDFNDREH